MRHQLSLHRIRDDVGFLAMKYDPFIDKSIPNFQDASNSYWHSTDSTITTNELEKNIDADIVIVGSGYTGLSCAMELAENGTTNVHVIEANSIGWGCSSRNAGFVLPGSGRLSYQQLVKRFGKVGALNLHEQYLAAIELLKTRISLSKANIDQTEKGYIKLAHSKNWFEKLSASAAYLERNFDYRVETIKASQFSKDFVKHNKAYGAIRYDNGFGINPLKLINSYAQSCLQSGVSIYSNSPLENLKKLPNGRFELSTPQGSIKADKVVLATNGYTPSGLNTPLNGRILPVLTSVIVTRPLSVDELEASGFKSHQVMMDTRELKYYYRLLPDNRILFGGRSAITGKEAQNPIYQQRLLRELKASFPGLENLTVDFNWQGWISVAYDQMPHVYKTDDNLFYATGYCGSGVSFSGWAGKQLADLVLERNINSPLFSELPKFPFAPFRRVGQRFFYQYGRLKDWLQ